MTGPNTGTRIATGTLATSRWASVHEGAGRSERRARQVRAGGIGADAVVEPADGLSPERSGRVRGDRDGRVPGPAGAATAPSADAKGTGPTAEASPKGRSAPSAMSTVVSGGPGAQV